MKPGSAHCCSGSLGRDDDGVPEVRWGSHHCRVLGRGQRDDMLGSPPVGSNMNTQTLSGGGPVGQS